MHHGTSPPVTAHITYQDQTLYCCGAWTVQGIQQLNDSLQDKVTTTQLPLVIDGSQLEQLDTAGAWLIYRSYHALKLQHDVRLQGFATEYQQLLDLVKKHHTVEEVETVQAPPFLHQLLVDVGKASHTQWLALIAFLSFIGEVAHVSLRLLLHPWQIRWRAVMVNVYHSGVTALPIIGLMAFLMGVVIAFQGGEQLRIYGANILIVDLVGITLLRELAPLLTAILVAGRSGSAYTAQIGTMRVTEEVDALRTMGISPMELLVFPKVLALIIALPLLSAFADVLGVLGGMTVASLSLDVNSSDFLDRFSHAVAARHYLVGLSKAPVFAVAITLIGCYQGFKVSGGADSVGKQVTISVVQAIFLVLIIDALFSIVLGQLGL